MLKKYSIIFLFFFAYTIVFGHSILPHHHHCHQDQIEHATSHHSGADSDDNLADDFESYTHSSTGDFYKQSDAKISHTAIASIYLCTLVLFNIAPAEAEPPIRKIADSAIPISQYCLSSKGLRGPPLA